MTDNSNSNKFSARDLRSRSTSLPKRSTFQPKRLKSTNDVQCSQLQTRSYKENASNSGKTVEDLLALGLTDAAKRASQRLRTQRLLAKQKEESKEQIRALEMQVKNAKRKGLHSKTSARAIRAFVDHKAGRLSATQTELHEKDRRKKIMEALNTDVRQNNSKLVPRKASQNSSATGKEALVKVEQREATGGAQRKPPVPRLSGPRRKKRAKRSSKGVSRNAKPPLPSFPRARHPPKVPRTSATTSQARRKAYKEKQVRAYMTQKRRKSLLAKRKLERQRVELLRSRERQLEELEQRSAELSAADQTANVAKSKSKREKPVKAVRHSRQGQPAEALMKGFKKQQQNAKIGLLQEIQEESLETTIATIRLSASGSSMQYEDKHGLDLLEDIEAVMNRQLGASNSCAEATSADAQVSPAYADPVVSCKVESSNGSDDAAGSLPIPELKEQATSVHQLSVGQIGQRMASQTNQGSAEGMSAHQESSRRVEQAPACKVSSAPVTSDSPESQRAQARLEADMAAMIRELREKSELVLEKTNDDAARRDPGIGNSLKSFVPAAKPKREPITCPEVSREESSMHLKSEVERISQQFLARAVAGDSLGDVSESTSLLKCKTKQPQSNRLEQWRRKAAMDPFSLISLLAEEEKLKAKANALEHSSNQSSAEEEEASVEAFSEVSVAGSIDLTSGYSEEFSRCASMDEETFRSISPTNRSVGSTLSKNSLNSHHEMQGKQSTVGLQTEQTTQKDEVVSRSLRQRIAVRGKESSGLLSPSTLKQKLLASVNYLENLEDTDKQLNALEHAQQLALSQQETVAVVERWKKQEEIAKNQVHMAKLSNDYAARFDNTVRQVQEDVNAAAAEEVKRAKAQATALAKQLESERKRTSQVQTEEPHTVERGTTNDATTLPRDIGVMTDRSAELLRDVYPYRSEQEVSEHYSVDDFDSGFSSEARTRLSQSVLSEILAPDEVRQSRDEEFLNANNRSRDSSPRPRSVWSPEVAEAESYCSTPRSATVSPLSPSRYSNDGFVNLDSRMDVSNLSERCLSPTESLRSVVPDEAFLREQTEDDTDDLFDCSGGSSFRKFATDLLQNYSRDVEVKRKHDLQILKMREKALKDKTREQLRWLVRQRDRALSAKKKRARSPHSSPKSEDTRMPTQRQIDKRLEVARRKITFSFKAGKATIEAEKAALNESFYKEKIRLRKHAKIFNKLQNEITLYKKDVVDVVHDGLFENLISGDKINQVEDFLEDSAHNLSVEEAVFEARSPKSTPTAASIKALSFASSIKSRPVESSYEKDSFLCEQDGDGLNEVSFKEKIELRDKEIAKMKEEIALKNDEIAKLKAAESIDGMLSQQDGALSAYSSDVAESSTSVHEASEELQQSNEEEVNRSLVVDKEVASSDRDNKAADAATVVDMIRNEIADDSFASTLPSIEAAIEKHSEKELAEDSFASTSSFITKTERPACETTHIEDSDGDKHNEEEWSKAISDVSVVEKNKCVSLQEERKIHEEVVLSAPTEATENESEESKLERRKVLTDILTAELLRELVDENVKVPNRPVKSETKEAIQTSVVEEEMKEEETKEPAAVDSKNEEPVVRGELYYDWTEYIKSYIDEVFSYVELKGGLQYKEDDCVESEEKASVKKKTDAISLKTYIDIERGAGRPEHLQIINKSIFDAMCEGLVHNFPSEFCHIKESTLVRKSLGCFLKQCRPKPSAKLMRELTTKYVLKWKMMEGGPCIQLLGGDPPGKGRNEARTWTQSPQESLDQILRKEMSEMEAGWIDYQQDEVQLMFELGDLMLEDLVHDTVKELLRVKGM